MRWRIALGAAAVVAAAALILAARGDGTGELPRNLRGTLVFVSDRSGSDALYVRRLPSELDVRLTWLTEPVADPALSPDASRAAFSAGGRIEIVHLTTGDVRPVTLGGEWLDAQPAWRPDGRALVVVARRQPGERGDLHLLDLAEGTTPAPRRPLTETPGFAEVDPVFDPSGSALVFTRQGGLHRLDLGTGETRRLTTGFREAAGPRFLPSGALAFLWSEGKRYGVDVLDPDGGRRTLVEGDTAYTRIAPSPDGTWLAVTPGLDLGFRLSELLKPRPTREVHLLDGRGAFVAPLLRAWGHSNHSADWGP